MTSYHINVHDQRTYDIYTQPSQTAKIDVVRYIDVQNWVSGFLAVRLYDDGLFTMVNVNHKYHVRAYNVSPAPDDPKDLYSDTSTIADVEIDSNDSPPTLLTNPFAVSGTQGLGPYVRVAVELVADGTGGRDRMTIGIELIGRDA